MYRLFKRLKTTIHANGIKTVFSTMAYNLYDETYLVKDVFQKLKGRFITRYVLVARSVFLIPTSISNILYYSLENEDLSGFRDSEMAKTMIGFDEVLDYLNTSELSDVGKANFVDDITQQLDNAKSIFGALTQAEVKALREDLTKLGYTAIGRFSEDSITTDIYLAKHNEFEIAIRKVIFGKALSKTPLLRLKTEDISLSHAEITEYVQRKGGN